MKEGGIKTIVGRTSLGREEGTYSSVIKGEEVSLSKPKTILKLWGSCGVRGRGDEDIMKLGSFNLLRNSRWSHLLSVKRSHLELENCKKKKKGTAYLVNVNAGWGITWSLKAWVVSVTLLNKNRVLSLFWFKFYSGLPLLFGMKIKILNVVLSPCMALPAFLGSLTLFRSPRC